MKVFVVLALASVAVAAPGAPIAYSSFNGAIGAPVGVSKPK